MMKDSKKGIAILLAIIVSAIALTVGLSLSIVAFKEIGISSNVRDSLRAYYASESVLNCVKYWIATNSDLVANGETVQCADTEGNNQTFTADPVMQGTFNLELILDTHKGVANIGIDNSGGQKTYVITANGYNTTNNESDRIIERLNKVEVIVTEEGESADILLIFDRSSSVCRAADTDPEEGVTDPYDARDCDNFFALGGEFYLMMTAIDSFLNKLAISPTENTVGVMSYADSVTFDNSFSANRLTLPKCDPPPPDEETDAGYQGLCNFSRKNTGRTVTGEALDTAVDLFTADDPRPNYPNVIVLVTDGNPSKVRNCSEGEVLDTWGMDIGYNGGSIDDCYGTDGEDERVELARDQAAEYTTTFKNNGGIVYGVYIGRKNQDGTLNSGAEWLRDDVATADSEDAYFANAEEFEDLEGILSSIAEGIQVTLLEAK